MTELQARERAIALSVKTGKSSFIYQSGKNFKVLAYQDIKEEYAFTIGHIRPGGVRVWQVVRKD